MNLIIGGENISQRSAVKTQTPTPTSLLKRPFLDVKNTFHQMKDHAKNNLLYFKSPKKSPKSARKPVKTGGTPVITTPSVKPFEIYNDNEEQFTGHNTEQCCKEFAQETIFDFKGAKFNESIKKSLLWDIGRIDVDVELFKENLTPMENLDIEYLAYEVNSIDLSCEDFELDIQAPF